MEQTGISKCPLSLVKTHGLVVKKAPAQTKENASFPFALPSTLGLFFFFKNTGRVREFLKQPFFLFRFLAQMLAHSSPPKSSRSHTTSPRTQALQRVKARVQATKLQHHHQEGERKRGELLFANETLIGGSSSLLVYIHTQSCMYIASDVKIEKYTGMG